MKFSLRQKELSEWQKHNFGTHEDDDLKCMVGMTEELGELAHLILKKKQGIREGMYNSEHLTNLISDAFGDVIIYGIQEMTINGIDAEIAITTTIEKVLKRDWTIDKLKGNE